MTVPMSFWVSVMLRLTLPQPSVCSSWHSCTDLETEGMEQGCLCHHCSPYPHPNPSGLPQVLPSPFLRSLCNFSSSWDILEPVQYGEGTGKPFKHPSSAGLGAGVEKRRRTGRKENDGNSRPPQLLRTPPPRHQNPKNSPLTLHQDPDQQDDAQQDKENVQAHDGSVQPAGGLGRVRERPGPGWDWGRGRTGDLQVLNTTTLVLTNTINSSVTYAHSSQYHQQL